MDSLTNNPIVLWLVLSAVLAALAWTFLRKELRLKAVLYGSFLIACFASTWPLEQKIKLGLDLKGGLHLVLRVSTDDALRATVGDAVSEAAADLNRAGMTTAKVAGVDASSFEVTGVEPARIKDARSALRDRFSATEWTLSEGVNSFKLTFTDPHRKALRERTVQDSIRTLERRVNALGVAEPVITPYGNTGDQILVQLPGVTDVEQAKRMIQTTCLLYTSDAADE